MRLAKNSTTATSNRQLTACAIRLPPCVIWKKAIRNWNKELRTAMETQLRDRYLKENRCQTGLYLVAWFSCAKWREDDQRKEHWPTMSAHEAEELFSKQATELSKEGYYISSYVLDVSLS